MGAGDRGNSPRARIFWADGRTNSDSLGLSGEGCLGTALGETRARPAQSLEFQIGKGGSSLLEGERTLGKSAAQQASANGSSGSIGSAAGGAGNAITLPPATRSIPARR